MLGPGIPHAWINSEEYYSKKLSAKAIVIQFSKDIFTEELLQVNDMVTINDLLDKSRYSIRFNHTGLNITRMLKKVCKSEGIAKYVALLNLLNVLSKHEDFNLTLNETEQACLLLNETNLNVSQICYECGYGSPSYFHRVFKKIKKMSPREYRNIHLSASRQIS